MKRIDHAYPKSGPWHEFAAKLLRQYHLPNGSRLALLRNGGAARTMRARVRNDLIIRRKPFRRIDHPNGRNVTVGNVVSRIEAMLAPSIRQSYGIAAFGPDGKRLDLRTHLGKWQQMEPKPTADELDEAALRLAEIRELAKLARTQLRDLEEAVQDPEKKVPHAIIQALVERYGTADVREALQELRLTP